VLPFHTLRIFDQHIYRTDRYDILHVHLSYPDQYNYKRAVHYWHSNDRRARWNGNTSTRPVSQPPSCRCRAGHGKRC
jgi:hypothetical protein